MFSKSQLLLSVFFASVLFVSSLATATAGSLRNPTSAKDCVVWKSGSTYSIARERLQTSYKQCTKNNPPSSNPNSPNHAFSFSTTCSGNYSRTCGPIKQKVCDLETKAVRQRKACFARLESYNLEQAHIKEKQKEFADKRRAAEQEERQRRLDQRRTQRQEFGRIKKYSDSALVTGVLAGRAATGTVPPLNGSFYLSNAISQAGSRFITNSYADALTQLEDSISGLNSGSNSGFVFSDDNPYPTQRQITNSVQKYAELQSLLRNIQGRRHKLPLGTQSIVNTSQGRLIDEIVKARVAGTISGPLASSLQQFVRHASRTQSNGTQSLDADPKLDNARQVALQQITKERERLRLEYNRAKRRLAEQKRRDAERQEARQRQARLEEQKRRDNESRANPPTESNAFKRVGRHTFPTCANVIVHRKRGVREYLSVEFIEACGQTASCRYAENGYTSVKQNATRVQGFYSTYIISCRL